MSGRHYAVSVRLICTSTGRNNEKKSKISFGVTENEVIGRLDIIVLV